MGVAMGSRGHVRRGSGTISTGMRRLSLSVKSLPREIELMDDEEEVGTLSSSSLLHDAGSVGGRSAASMLSSRRSIRSGNRIPKHTSPNRSPRSTQSRERTVRRAIPQEIDVSGHKRSSEKSSAKSRADKKKPTEPSPDKTPNRSNARRKKSKR